ncbi:MAG: MFS transporter [Chloroflexota bacterium]
MKRLSTAKILLYSVGNMGSNLVFAFANFAFPLFLSAYPVSNMAVGFLAQERSFAGAFVQPIVGAISDRLPPNRLGRRRPFFLVGVPLTALALAVLSVQPPLWAVVGIMTFFALFLAMANDPYMALLPDITPVEQRGRVGGVMAIFTALGGILAILLSFFLWEQNQELVFWLVAIGLVVPFAITFFAIKEPPVAGPPPARSRRPQLRGYAGDLWARRELMKYLGATFLFWLGNGGITPFVTRFGVSVLGVEENVSFLLVLPAILGAAVFALPAGLLTERFGKKPVLAGGMALFGLAGMVGSQIVHTLPQALALMTLVGVAIATANALIFPLLADMIPRGRAGEFTGIGNLVWSVAQPIGAVAAGAMADATGTLRGAFLAGGLAMFAAFLVLLWVHPEPATEDRPEFLTHPSLP